MHKTKPISAVATTSTMILLLCLVFFPTQPLLMEINIMSKLQGIRVHAIANPHRCTRYVYEYIQIIFVTTTENNRVVISNVGLYLET